MLFACAMLFVQLDYQWGSDVAHCLRLLALARVDHGSNPMAAHQQFHSAASSTAWVASDVEGFLSSCECAASPAT